MASDEEVWMARMDSAEVLLVVIDGLSVGVTVADHAGKIVLWNRHAERLTGFLRQDVIGRSVPRRISGRRGFGEQRFGGRGGAGDCGNARRQSYPAGSIGAASSRASRADAAAGQRASRRARRGDRRG